MSINESDILTGFNNSTTKVMTAMDSKYLSIAQAGIMSGFW